MTAEFTTPGVWVAADPPGRHTLRVPEPTRRRGVGGARLARTNAPTSPVSIMLVDDHPLWRDVLNKVLIESGVGKVVAHASTGVEAVEVSKRASPGLVIMDVDLPGMDGIETARQLVSERQNLRILMLSGFADREKVIQAVRAGASGYMLKTSGAAEIAEAVRRVSAGELVFPPSLADVVLDELRHPGSSAEALSREVSLQREGEYWTVQLGGTVSRFRDSKGLHYLAFLLRHPGLEFHVHDLATEVEGSQPPDGIPRARDEALAAAQSLGDAGPLLDDKAKRAYRRRLAELQEEVDEAQAWGDSERASRARAEMEILAEHLASALGLSGRDRSAASHAERQRVRVTKAIRSAVNRVADADARLGAHLRATIRTGAFCSYAQDRDPSFTWVVNP